MTGSAYQKYDPSDHAEQYGWLWTEDAKGTPGWHMVFTIEDDDQLRVYFVAADQIEDAEDFAGCPFMAISEPPTSGDLAPGYILQIDDHGGLRTTWSWAAEGTGNDEFSASVRQIVDHALTGGRAA